MIVALLAAGGLQAAAQVPAFPGAQGYGRYAKGGRGGQVYYVTTLEDTGEPGSLRYGAQLSKATILFKVSGTIHLKSSLTFSGDFLTVAGQSAPGDGICLADYPCFVSGNNVIVRYMRFRMGDRALSADGADGADAFGGRFCHNVIIDHCSISWSTDECASFYANYDFTMQWCVISESLRKSLHSKGTHGYGAIWGGIGASYYHNLIIHHDSRTPRLGTGNIETPDKHVTDIRNNVIYNYSGNGCYGAEGMHVNMVNNYYKPGKATEASSAKDKFIAIDDATSDDGTTSIWGKYYIAGNYNSKYTTVNADNWRGVSINTSNLNNGNATEADVRSDTELGEAPLFHQFEAEACFGPVMDYAGCSYRRDAIDERLIDECRNGTYHFTGASARTDSHGFKGGLIDTVDDLKPEDAGDDWSPWPELESKAAPADYDGDGIPDNWEDFNGLDPSDPTDGNKLNAEGYTMLEVYLNSLVSRITEAQYAGSLELGDPGRPYDPEAATPNATLTWKMDTHTVGEQAEASTPGLALETPYELGPELKLIGSETSGGTVYTKFQPTVEYRAKSATAYIAYNISLADGVSARPVTLDVSALRYGTSGGRFDVAWVDGSGNETVVEAGLHAADPKGTESPVQTVAMVEADGIDYTTGHCQLRLYVYSLSPQKAIGFANVKLGLRASGVDGIGGVGAAAGKPAVYYDLSGRPSGEPRRGVNIAGGKKFVFK